MATLYVLHVGWLHWWLFLNEETDGHDRCSKTAHSNALKGRGTAKSERVGISKGMCRIQCKSHCRNAAYVKDFRNISSQAIDSIPVDVSDKHSKWSIYVKLLCLSPLGPNVTAENVRKQIYANWFTFLISACSLLSLDSVRCTTHQHCNTIVKTNL